MAFAFEPYNGDKPYVFISYCRDDRSICEELIRRLGAKGIRLWYDNEIHVGDAWPEIIATKLQASHVCVLLITSNFVASINCNRELTFASQKEIPLLPVRVEGTNITPGIGLMIGSIQYIKIPREGSGAYALNALDKVCEAPRVMECVEEHLKIQREPEQKHEDKPQESIEKKPTQKERNRPEVHKEPSKKPDALDPSKAPITQETLLVIDERKNKVYAAIGTNFSIALENGALRVRTEGAESGIAAITFFNGEAFLESKVEALYSATGELRKCERVKLHLNRVLRLEYENLLFSVLIGNAAERIRKHGSAGMLFCTETDEKKWITEESTILGRRYIWPKGTLEDPFISDENAVIVCDEHGFSVQDTGSLNGTIYNGNLLARSETAQLADGDSIQLGATFLRFAVFPVRS